MSHVRARNSEGEIKEHTAVKRQLLYRCPFDNLAVSSIFSFEQFGGGGHIDRGSSRSESERKVKTHGLTHLEREAVTQRREGLGADF